MEQWRQERNEALAAMNMEWARQMMPTASDDHVRLTAMHKVRYECTDLADELRLQSGDWLRQHGYSRMDGTALLPEGKLPICGIDA